MKCNADLKFMYASTDGCYVLTKIPVHLKCRRDALSIQDTLDLAAFLGEQLRNLHMLPCPSFVSQSFSDIGQTVESQVTNHQVETHLSSSKVTAEWNIFLGTLSRKKMTLASRLTRW